MMWRCQCLNEDTYLSQPYSTLMNGGIKLDNRNGKQCGVDDLCQAAAVSQQQGMWNDEAARALQTRDQARIYAKLEWYNPFGSVKDRVAENLLRDAGEKGFLGEGQKLVEPTSGNTGMGLAMLANAKGYSLTTPLSMKIPSEKRVMLRMFGTNVEELDDDL